MARPPDPVGVQAWTVYQDSSGDRSAPDGDGLLSEQIVDPADVAEGCDASSDSGRNVPNAGASDPDGDGLDRVLRRVAAYKRRQRAKQRLAAVLRPAPRPR